MTTAWSLLVVAGLFEVGWPIGLKIGQTPGKPALVGIPVAILCMGISGWLLFLAQRQIPLGTAYAVWTGIGAAGTFLVGVLFFGDAASLVRFLGVLLIVAGVATLKLGH
jgi:quaternary ammonium compound-resistance protein SugE